MHPAWVTRRPSKSRISWSLTARGRAIVERDVPAHIRGVGPYHGLRALRRNVVIPPRSLTAVPLAPVNGPLGDAIRRILAGWASLNRPRGFNEALVEQGRLDRLGTFVCEYVRQHNELPRGFHIIDGAAYNAGPFIVDFDERRGD